MRDLDQRMAIAVRDIAVTAGADDERHPQIHTLDGILLVTAMASRTPTDAATMAALHA
jgi:hypothetical protein